MFIKMFINADTEDESMKIVEDILSPLNTYFKRTNKIKLEPYWKIKDMYSIDVDIDLNVNILEKKD